MRKPLIFLLHLGFWSFYFLLLLVLLYALFSGEEVSRVDEQVLAVAFLFMAFLPPVITFYTFYFYLFPRFFRRQRFLLTVVYGVMLALGTTVIGYAILRYALYPECAEAAGEVNMLCPLLFLSFMNANCGGVAVILQGFLTWFEEVKLKEELQAKNHEMELTLVKSQLDPHFLFNTINNIDVLILKNPEEASEYLNRLSDIMRFMLYETKTEEIPLQREIEYIEKFVALQSIRTANPSYVNFAVDGPVRGRVIAPMIFIPFLENAFKHSPNKKVAEAIRVRINVLADTIRLTCHNKVNPNRLVNEQAGGLGNELIRRRLLLLYPDRHQLIVRQNQHEYQVQLTITT